MSVDHPVAQQHATRQEDKPPSSWLWLIPALSISAAAVVSQVGGPTATLQAAVVAFALTAVVLVRGHLSSRTPTAQAVVVLVAVAVASAILVAAEVPAVSSALDGRRAVPDQTDDRDADRRELERLATLRQEVRELASSDRDLRGARLNGLRAPEAQFNELDLRGASLRGAHLRDADLRKADLRGADLVDACLAGARLDGAQLTGTELLGADLTGATADPTALRSSSSAPTGPAGKACN